MATIKQLEKKEETIVAAIAALNDKLADKKQALKDVREDKKLLAKAEKEAAQPSKKSK